VRSEGSRSDIDLEEFVDPEVPAEMPRGEQEEQSEPLGYFIATPMLDEDGPNNDRVFVEKERPSIFEARVRIVSLSRMRKPRSPTLAYREH